MEKPVTKAEKEKKAAMYAAKNAADAAYRERKKREKEQFEAWNNQLMVGINAAKKLFEQRQNEGWKMQTILPKRGVLLWQENFNGFDSREVLTECYAIDGNQAFFRLVDERQINPYKGSGLLMGAVRYWQEVLPLQEMRVLAPSEYPKTLSVTPLPAEAFGNADEIAEWEELAKNWENAHTFKSYFELIPQVKILSKKACAFNEGDTIDAELVNCERLKVGDTKENGWGVFLGVEPKSVEKKTRIRPDWALPERPEVKKPWDNGRKLDFVKNCLVAVCPEAEKLCTSNWLMGSADRLTWSANGLEYTAMVSNGQVTVTVDELPDRVPYES